MRLSLGYFDALDMYRLGSDVYSLLRDPFKAHIQFF